MSSSALNIEAEIDRLYGLPLAEFVSARNELAKRARKEINREVAERVKALPKPSVTAWAVNRLHYDRPGAFAEALSAGARIKDAHGGEVESLRGAMQDRRKAIGRLVEMAEALLESAGHPTTRAHLRRISRTIEALSVLGDDPSSDAWPRPGRLSGDLEPPGFGALAGFAMAPPSAKSKEAKRPRSGRTPTQPLAEPAKREARTSAPRAAVEPAKKEKKADAAAKRRLERARRALEAVEAKLVEERAQLFKAQRALTAAERAHERAQKRADDARRKAEEAEQSAVLTQAGLDEAVARESTARGRVEELEQAVADAQNELLPRE